ncbi:MAG: glycoside hydrolase family 97 protein [Ferruginibacter sp.]|nr:glycoside hydrolase family 97 protein [Ferruginibacter sp.]
MLAQKATSINVQMNNVQLVFTLDEKGTPQYAVNYRGVPVIKKSSLGLQLSDVSLDNNFEIKGIDSTVYDTNWKPVLGEVSEVRDHHKELTIHLKQTNAGGKLMNIIFRVFEDGVGFRYDFPKQQDLKYFVVTDEHTQFNFAGDHKAFWIPGDYDTNEYPYTHSRLSAIDNRKLVETSTDIAVRVAPDPYAVQTPLMLTTDNGLYINIHEAALVNYPAMQLHVNQKTFSLSSRLVPDPVGNKAYLHAPCATPWRTIIISNKATDILASKMILNLNEPSKLDNTDWIKPMKFIGVWWEMQTGKGSWNYSDASDNVDANGKLVPNGKHSANTANVKRYIDFAAANGIKGVLVEGWNYGWEDWFGNWKEKTFDFVKPYPDFDVEALQQYAASKNVNIIMHNETSGGATDYERQLDTAYRFMNRFGYVAVKTGYVGKIIPRGEHHDGQWMIDHYIRVAQKAADHKVMVDMHETVRPTGLNRTYPNWIANEAGRGNEYNAFSIGSSPDHETILPFTRCMGGPMDYTPGIFKLRGYVPGAPQRQMHSTLAKQLALYVTLYSPLQMAADLPENYAEHMDAFQFIKDVAADWQDTKIIEAEPGEYITIARKEKGSANWFAGAITGENSRKALLPLDFLDNGAKYVATIYRDAANADWKNNPGAYVIEKFLVDEKTRLSLSLANGGGAAVSILPASASDLKALKKYR